MTNERFNPFKELSCKYGAPMGRASIGQWDGVQRLNCKHCGGDGYYDRGGAYWGHSRVYAVYTPSGDYVQYVEATNRKDALNQVYKEYDVYPNIRIYEKAGTADKYTAIFMDREEKRHYNGFGRACTIEYEALAFNENPFHPLGIGMHVSAIKGVHLGKLVPFDDLSGDAQEFIRQNV